MDAIARHEDLKADINWDAVLSDFVDVLDELERIRNGESATTHGKTVMLRARVSERPGADNG